MKRFTWKELDNLKFELRQKAASVPEVLTLLTQFFRKFYGASIDFAELQAFARAALNDPETLVRLSHISAIELLLALKEL